MKYKCFIFDFDFTLADASSAIVKCYNSTLNTFGYKSAEEYDIKRTIGLTLEQGFNRLTGEASPEKLHNMKQTYISFADEIMTKSTLFYPDALDAVRKIKSDGGLVGIVTTKLSHRVTDALEYNNIAEFFDTITGCDDVTVAKPSPEGLLKTIIKLGVSKNEVLYVGDSTVDARTAKNAGVDFAAVLTGVTRAAEFEGFPCIQMAESMKKLFELIEWGGI